MPSPLMGAGGGGEKEIRHEKLGQTPRKISKVDCCRNNVERYRNLGMQGGRTDMTVAAER